MELQRYFGIYDHLNPKTAPSIWERANERLASDDLSVASIFHNFSVAAVGTTDDPADDLGYHVQIKNGTAAIGKIETKVLPSFRPDKALLAQAPGFADYIGKLGMSAGIEIRTVDDVCEALAARLQFFVQNGCRASDHGIAMVPYLPADDATIQTAFHKALARETLSGAELEAYQTKVMVFLGEQYAKNDIVMQLHVNSLRNLNPPKFTLLGPDTGFDASHDLPLAGKLAGFLGLLEAKHSMPKTVLYTLNPKDYYVMATQMGSFQGDGIPGKIQLGSGWWFCDHKDGMEEQMRILANLGSLPRFIGMLTDSRSFLSYPRHEYFRRILCNLLGTWAEEGQIPADIPYLGSMVQDIAFRNALRYFS